jgi:ABC-2 type transport system ATP-binding protein
MSNGRSGGTSAIQLDHVSKSFGDFQAVRDLSLEVQKGEIMGFLGLNGAGKTTTIKMLLSLLKPTSGNIYLLGSKVDSGNYKLWSRVGYLEEASYYPDLTVVENLEIARRMHRISDRGAVDRVIRKLDLDIHRKKKAKNLSLGNRQRLGLAKAMIHNPEVLILDEPVNGLDPASVVEIRELLLDLSRNDGVTIFLSSHLLEELSKLVDSVAIMHKGRLVQNMKMDQLERALEKKLVIDGRDIDTIRHILSEHGYTFKAAADERLELTEERALRNPEQLADLLVRASQPPTHLSVVTENLESYFLRAIHTAGGNA